MPAAGRSTIDYTEAERRFVVEGKSIRAIAKEMGLKSWSSMASIAKRDDWVGKRQAYLAAIARRSYETAAATQAGENNAIRDEAVLAARATIRQYLNDLSVGNIKVTPKDAHLWAQLLLDEMRAPLATSTEAPNVRNVTPPDTEHLRRIVEAARGRVDPPGSLGSTALVESPRARPN